MMFSPRWSRAAAIPLLALLMSAPLPSAQAVVQPQAVTQPQNVSVPGSFNSEIGCSSDWLPDCDQAQLTFDATDQLWQKSVALPAGNYEHKVAINKSWAENYGANAAPGGANIALNLAATTTVKFYYDHATHWVANNVTNKIATVAGSFQSELGCPSDWSPDCLRSWMQDVDGDGRYSFSTTSLPLGSYEFKVALNETWDVSYPSQNVPLTVATAGEKIVINWNSRTNEVTIGEQLGDLSKAKAHWLDRSTVAWNVDPAPQTIRLISGATAGLVLAPTGIQGGEAITLTRNPAGLSDALKAKFPHLASYPAYTIAEADLAKVRAMLKGQLAVDAANNGTLIDATSVQIPGVLDDLYTYTGELGIVYNAAVPTLRLWAPTAKSVKLHVFNDATTTVSTTLTMAGDPETGVWSATGDASWTNKYYLYEVEVFTRATNTVVKNLVTDPYAVSLSLNSARGQVVNLDDAALKPTGWDATAKPRLDAPEDIVLYELHVRDFSASDSTVPEAERGTFKAFTEQNSNGMRHLKALQQAGLTHIHLLPAFDCASINENKSQWQSPDPAVLATYPPTSTLQRDAVQATAETDGFNWCYDPFHYTVPEGSYSTNPNDTTRIREFREMVQSLNTAGLRVVMDVVYNHTNASGQNDKSVLDKVVPGYYHRLNSEGAVETSTCCQNTATEHAMMEKLMVDSLVTWARDYKVDGFRFDLMGHHSLANMEKVRDTLQALTVANDGVDGKAIYIYGEGWNFGEVANDARFKQATQLNLAGSGLGSFNDRLRDAAKGGSPFTDVRVQGFATGLFTNPNAFAQGTADEQKATLLLHQDQIRASLTGNLKNYQFFDRTGVITTGAFIPYNGGPAAYTSDPQESINYVEAHDNKTLFDSALLKAAPGDTLNNIIRTDYLATDLAMLSQGVPFFHAGQDILRSKSFDEDSYNSGDWFNRLDWSYQTNNFSVGLPPTGIGSYPIYEPLLANPAMRPTSDQIKAANAHFRDMLQIRKSSSLFRLRTAAEVQQHLSFLGTGPNQVPGVVTMQLTDTRAVRLDNPFSRVIVVFNATRTAQQVTNESLKGLAMQLHPVQQRSTDPALSTAGFDSASGSMTVPPLSTVVFVQTSYQTALPFIGRR